MRAYPEACSQRFRGCGHLRAAKVEANERIRATQEELEIDGGNRRPFLCECDAAACRTIRATASEYGEARSSGWYVVAQGYPGVRRVESGGDGYAVGEA